MAKLVKGVAIALPILLLSGGALAAWLMDWGDDYTATVSSEEVIFEVTQTFTDMNLNTTLGEAVNTSTAMITNPDGDIPMTASITVDKMDNTSDTCTDYENDCAVETKLNGAVINDLDPVTIVSGNNTLQSTVNCTRFSCPQMLNVTILMSE